MSDMSFWDIYVISVSFVTLISLYLKKIVSDKQTKQ